MVNNMHTLNSFTRSAVASTLLAFVVSLHTQTVYALGKVTRSCRHSDIPATFQMIARTQQYGEWRWNISKSDLPAYTDYYGPLFRQNPALERDYWSLESFTSDYWVDAAVDNARPGRYWLRAYAHVWARTTDNCCFHIWFRTYDSGWVADPKNTDLPQVGALPTGFTKLFLFRARGGSGVSPRFFEPFPTAASFKIKGVHEYYDPLNPNDGPQSLGETRVLDSCNFEHWGFALEK